MNLTKQHLGNTLLSFALLNIIILTFSGCKKDEETSPKNPIIKYEVISGAPFAIDSSLGLNTSLYINFTNATGQVETERLQLVGTSTFTREITLTSTQRPISIYFTLSGLTSSLGTGTSIANIYMNGELKASQNMQITPLGNGKYNFVVTPTYPLSFIIK